MKYAVPCSFNEMQWISKKNKYLFLDHINLGYDEQHLHEFYLTLNVSFKIYIGWRTM